MPRQPSFPLFSLPSKALNQVFKCFEWHDLFELSFCSRSAKNAVREWTHSQPPQRMLCVFFVEGVYEINIENRNAPTFCGWRFYSTRNIPDYLLDRPRAIRNRLIKQRVIEFNKHLEQETATQRNLVFTHIANRREPLVLDTVEYLMDLFNVGIQSLKINIAYTDFPEIILNAKWILDTDSLRLAPGTLKANEMTWLLKHAKTQYLQIESTAGRRYDFERTISVPEVYFRNSHISRRQLLDLDCEMIILRNNELFTNDDYNAFVKQWYESDDQKLKFLLAKFYGDLDVLNRLSQEEILKGIEYYPGCKKTYDPICPGETQWLDEFENGLDIFRSDGKKATMLIEECEHESGEQIVYLQFIVWHQESADLEDEYYWFYNLFR